jgi:phage tail tape-measure protein
VRLGQPACFKVTNKEVLELMADDKIQHGIDDNPKGDAKKGAVLGGAGGAAVGAAAGAAVGPAGAVIGAAVGGLAGAIGSGAAVGAVDKYDNDNAISGLGDGATDDVDEDAEDLVPGNRIPGVQTGGRAADGTPDTRGMTEKAADAVTGDRTDDKTGKRV